MGKRLLSPPEEFIKKFRVDKNLLALTYKETIEKYRVDEKSLSTELISSLRFQNRIATVFMYISLATLPAGIAGKSWALALVYTCSPFVCWFFAATAQYHCRVLIQSRIQGKIIPFEVFLNDSMALKQIFHLRAGRW